LKRIGTLGDAPATLATAGGPGGSTLTVADHRLTLEGQDKRMKRWHVDLFEASDCAGGAQVYEGDLDRDGVTDVILFRPTCGNGLAPPEHLVAITFDAAGRPLPFEAEGYSDSDEHGVDELVDLDRNGQADLIFMNFSDGYWITNVYSVDRGRWRRAAGKSGGHTFPMYTRFTNTPNRRPVVPAVNRHPWAPDLSNTSARLTGTLVDWHWPDRTATTMDISALDLRLTVVGPNRQRTVCAPRYWPDSARLIVDEPEERRVIHLSRDDRSAVDPILARLVSQKMALQLFGRRDANRCSPELIWASPTHATAAPPDNQTEPTRRMSRAMMPLRRALVSVADAKATRHEVRADERRPIKRLQPTAPARRKRRG
jgi:hypothetical protein